MYNIGRFIYQSGILISGELLHMTNQPPTPTYTPARLKSALQAWAEAQGIKPPDFSRRMGYSYNHAYQLLVGDTDVTDGVMGRLLLSYGPDAAAQVINLAGVEAAPVASGQLPLPGVSA